MKTSRIPRRVGALDDQPSLTLDVGSAPLRIDVLSQGIDGDSSPPGRLQQRQKLSEERNYLNKTPIGTSLDSIDSPAQPSKGKGRMPLQSSSRRSPVVMAATFILVLMAATAAAWFTGLGKNESASRSTGVAEPSSASASGPTLAPTLPYLVVASASSAVVLSGFGSPAEFTSSHNQAFAEGIAACSSILTSASQVKNIAASLYTSRRRRLVSGVPLSVSFDVQVELRRLGFVGADADASLFSAEVMVSLASDLAAAANGTSSNSSLVSLLSRAFEAHALNSTGLGVDSSATLEAVGNLAESVAVASIVATLNPTLQPTPTFVPSLAPSSGPTAVWVPMEDASLVAWWSLDRNFDDESGLWNLSSVLSSEFSNYANVTEPLSPSDEGFFQLGGNFPSSGGAYGPTLDLANSAAASTSALTGGVSPSLDDMPPHMDVALDGLTLCGWVLGENGGPGGHLFGFGTASWNTPSLLLQNGYGFVTLTAGKSSDSLAVRYDSRSLWDGCWHFLALVVSPGYARVELYVDGVNQTAVTVLRLPAGGSYAPGGSPSLLTSASGGHSELFGGGSASAFRIGTNGDGRQRIDEVSLWGRALNLRETEAVAALKTAGAGDACLADDDGSGGGDAGGGGSSGGTRCDTAAGLGRDVPVDLVLRWFSSDTMVIVSDPTAYLHDEVHARCGASLAATEAAYRLSDPTSWHLNYEYKYAALEVVDLLRPPMMDRIAAAGHFNVTARRPAPADPAPVHVAPRARHLWPNAAREMRVARARAGGGFDYAAGGHEMTATAEVQYFTYLVLEAPLQEQGAGPEPGRDYCVGRAATAVAVLDGFGNAANGSFSDCASVSFALKVCRGGSTSRHYTQSH